MNEVAARRSAEEDQAVGQRRVRDLVARWSNRGEAGGDQQRRGDEPRELALGQSSGRDPAELELAHEVVGVIARAQLVVVQPSRRWRACAELGTPESS